MTNDLRIADAPLLVDVSGEEKIPTGGYGNYSTTINQIADFTQLKWKLATEGYVNNEINVVTNKLNTHTQDKTNPHGVTKEQVGLGEVDNTADLDKPVSAYQQSAIDEKIAKTSIVDNLTTDDSNKVLSAKQGKILQDNKANKTDVDTSLNLKANKSDVYTKDETLKLEREDKYVITWSGRSQELRNKDFVFIEDFENLNTSENDFTLSIQAAIDYTSDNGGGVFYGLAKTYMFSQLTWRDNVGFIGKGRDKTVLKQITDTNKTAIIGTNVQRPYMRDWTLDGNYLSGGRYENSTVINNLGNGIIFEGLLNPHIDISVRNVGGIGFMSTGFTGSSDVSFGTLPFLNIGITETRKEGLIIQGGFGDGKFGNVWVGLAGLFPRSELNDSSVSKVSDIYTDKARIDGIVIESSNIEYGHIHSWAHWFGCGFRTIGNCRMTGGVIISESNNKQLDISNGTYGSMSFDVRNLATYHPNYLAGDAYRDQIGAVGNNSQTNELFATQCDIQSGGSFKANITVRNIHIGAYHIPFTTAVSVTSSAKVDVVFTGATGTTSNSKFEVGSVFAGNVIDVGSNHATINVSAQTFNGAVYVLGGRNDITVNLKDCKSGSFALIRDSNGNNGSNAGNSIRGTISDCVKSFNSVGAPQSETIDLQINWNSSVSGSEALSGTMPTDLTKDMMWNINLFDRGTGLPRKTTHKWRGGVELSASVDTAQIATIPHRFAYAPQRAQVQLSIIDTGGISSARLEYCVVNSITATDIVVAYKYASIDATSNQYVCVLIS